MALQAVAVKTRDAPVQLTPRQVQPARVTELHPTSRIDLVAAARHERRRWLVIAALVYATPFVACLGVLEVVR